MKTSTPPNRRGQATVELAVLMVVLVPTFLYVLTADDLLRYRLNLQEVVVASPWDYTHLNYERAGMLPGEALETPLQEAYANINRGHVAEAVAAQAEERERTASMTFAGWEEGGLHQRVRCERVDIAGELGNSSQLAGALARQVNRGGLYGCNAALGVRNVLLINRFFQEWTEVEVTDKTPGTAEAVWGLNRQFFSVVADTWAMTQVRNVTPTTAGRGTVLYGRVQSIYTASPQYTAAHTSARQLAMTGQDIGVLNASLLTQDSDAGWGDNTQTPEVGFSTGAAPQMRGFDASPWRNQGARGGTYEAAYNARENAYMGRQLP